MRDRPPSTKLTAFDLRSFGRCVGASAAVASLALVVLATTDSDHPSWWARVARLSAMSPVFGLIGTGLGLGQAKARGEWLALASVGVHPFRASAGLLTGAWVITALGVLAASLPVTDLAALFPAVPHTDWMRDGAVWSSASAGVRLGPGREAVTWVDAVAVGQPLAPLRIWVVAAIASAGVWTPAWLLIECSGRERVITACAGVAAQLWAFHAVASTRTQGWILLSGSAVLAVHGVMRAVRGARANRRSLGPDGGRVTQIP